MLENICECCGLKSETEVHIRNYQDQEYTICKNESDCMKRKVEKEAIDNIK